MANIVTKFKTKPNVKSITAKLLILNLIIFGLVPVYSLNPAYSLDAYGQPSTETDLAEELVGDESGLDGILPPDNAPPLHNGFLQINPQSSDVPPPKAKPGQYVIKLKDPNFIDTLPQSGYDRPQGGSFFVGNSLGVSGVGERYITVYSKQFFRRSPTSEEIEKLDFAETDVSDNFCHHVISAGVASSCSPDYETQAQSTPNDVFFPSQWNLVGSRGIRAVGGWANSVVRESLLVGVVDSGVDWGHEDLAGAIWTNNLEVAGNDIDDDKNGIVDDIFGINTSSPSPWPAGHPTDDNYHGTHIAGIIAARSNNQIGIAGVASNVRLVIAKALNEFGSGSASSIITAFNYLYALKVFRNEPIRLINCSFGQFFYSQPLIDTIDYAGQIGITVVLAAGNNATDINSTTFWPASLAETRDHVITVGNHTSQLTPHESSNWGNGRTVTLFAPGTDILSTIPGGGYGWATGTSMAAPHVTGSLALFLQKYPSLTPRQLKNALIANGTSLGSSFIGRSESGGRLNLQRLMNN
jgi:subtilisin family serine protease